MNECPEPSDPIAEEEARACARALLALNLALELARSTPLGARPGPWTSRAVDALAPGGTPLALWRRCLRVCNRDLLERLPGVRIPR